MSKKVELSIKCNNSECGRMITIPVYCNDEDLLEEYMQEERVLPCPYCNTVNSCSMENMRNFTLSDNNGM
jgi:hypothetical protein